jgi:hypothetical protein
MGWARSGKMLEMPADLDQVAPDRSRFCDEDAVHEVFYGLFIADYTCT